jgi:predicted nucleic acid-binding protein
MSDKAFFDTNIFFYAWDKRDSRKRSIATETIQAAESLVISTQVAQEFYAAATRKLHMASSEATMAVAALCGLAMVSTICVEIMRAIGIERRYQLTFWNALIVSAAETAGASIFFTEDLTHGQRSDRFES